MKDKTAISRRELHELLDQIILWDALELCQGIDEMSKESVLYIPYLMNDAVEYYIELRNYKMEGNLSGRNKNLEIHRIEDHVPMGFRIHCTEDGDQENEDVIVWYQEAYLHIHCYQYHLIGHDWRKERGESFQRRLVNLICVIHDKRTYLGDMACSELEDWLADLAEFPPFLYYTPINKSILDWYPDSYEGIEAARLFAGNNAKLLDVIDAYEEKYESVGITLDEIEMYAKELLKKEYKDFWYKIQDAIMQASLCYEERPYNKEVKDAIINHRQSMESYYKKKGYDGSYPYMTYSDSPLTQSSHEIYFVEQHPFTVLEWEDYPYAFFEIHVTDGNLSECKWIKK